MKEIKTQPNSGLTLVETLVAISILLIAVVGPMVIYAQSIADARYAGDKITASYLAQEGVEFIKQKIYTNMNNGVEWLSNNLYPQCSVGQNCKVDVLDDKICFTGGPTCGVKLKLNNDGVYGYVSGIDTAFSRDVSIVENVTDQEATISATVSWMRAGQTKSVTVSERMFKWR